MTEAPTTEAPTTSTVDINTHHQKEAFEDADHDVIEDYSVDKVLEEAEKTHDVDELKPVVKGNGLGLGSMLDNDASKPDSYTEEVTDAAGHHFHKKVQKGDGWQQVEISSDGPMDINDIGGFIGQMMQEQMAARMQQQHSQGAMRQIHMTPIMMGPPPSLLQHIFDDFEEDHELEDHLAFIREMEANRRRPTSFPGFGNPVIEVVRNDHALVPSDDPLAHLHDEMFSSHNHQEKPHVHNDSGEHGALYMFGSVFLIAAIGILLWMVAVKDSATSLSDMLKAKQSSGGAQDSTKEIRLSSFNKAK